MRNNSIKKLWNEYRKIHQEAPKEYDAWAFGDSAEMADQLLALVLDGTKTATSSNYLLYGEDEPLPFVGQHNILLDGNGTAKAIIVTTAVEIVPFDEVTEEFAYMEGEGDRSLQYWRQVHEEFFKKELKEANLAFHDKIPVVCEKFQLIYKK